MITDSGLTCDECGKYILPLFYDDYKCFTNGDIHVQLHKNCVDSFFSRDGVRREDSV